MKILGSVVYKHGLNAQDDWIRDKASVVEKPW